ncbi:MAG: DUF4874 domain-containing protein, partial [Sandaracinaceae bacterium]|nr:DUF4874 domain-containing protein [Sandaracinaceae bacterium]MDW8246073.1 DUF4874 domain-containing protein [Sandaracinaceae bacterium]
MREVGRGNAQLRTVVFHPSDAVIPNPERGFYRYVELLEEEDLSWVHEQDPEDTLIFSYVRLDDFRSQPITSDFLNRLRDALARVRRAGFSAIIRFAYNFGPYPHSEPDAPLARILEHIAQLESILRENADVIALVQAGFIGAWGEWHTSTHGLDMDPNARRMVVERLLRALP